MAYMLNASVICEDSSICNQIEQDVQIREVNDIVFHGRITNCRGEAVEGAVVKVFCKKYCGTLTAIDHTFSGCDGYYMINIPRSSLVGCKCAVVMASASNCNMPQPCPGSPYSLSTEQSSSKTETIEENIETKEVIETNE